ncbi:Cytosolic Fe-S cluster assembly factor nubp1 [Schistosoma japonicum]|nr:Cytosolic Fe-S cluster assembly factor nubp1 [Schistosoma japonicum]
MSDVPVDAPSPCPGTKSELAGKASACEGCPNQSLCSSGQAKLPLSQREPDTILSIKRRLSSIRHRIIILSGKGGVGKSSLSVCLARGLSRRERMQAVDCDDTYRIGLLDLDLCGPSIPCMFGCINEQVHQSQSGWSPVFVTENLCLMSIGFLLPNPDHPVIWRGPRKNTLIRQLLTDVAWTEEDSSLDQGNSLDFLIIDTPPGTSDEHLSVVQYLQAAECLDGAIIITTPQEVALCDVRKQIDFCRKLSIPILGIVENMVEFVCPTCKYTYSLLPPSTGGASSLCTISYSERDDKESSLSNLEIIGRLPLDPRLTRALDEGLCPFELAESNSFKSEQPQDSNGGLQSSDAVIISFQELFNNLLKKLHN